MAPSEHYALVIGGRVQAPSSIRAFSPDVHHVTANVVSTQLYHLQTFEPLQFVLDLNLGRALLLPRIQCLRWVFRLPSATSFRFVKPVYFTLCSTQIAASQPFAATGQP